MTQESGQRWLITSAAVVGGVYAYTKWRGRNDTPIEKFVVSWGVTFFVLALITEASPRFGGAFSALVMVSDLLANGRTLFELVEASQRVTGTDRRSTRRRDR